MVLGQIMLAVIIIGLPLILMIVGARGYYRLQEKKLDVESTLAAEKAAQYAASNAELEARVRTLEKIVTDGGYQTANQIEALRDPPRVSTGDKVR